MGRCEAHAFDRGLERNHAAAILKVAPQRLHVGVAVDDAGLRRQQCADAGKLRLERAGRIAADQLQAFDAVGLGLLADRLDLGQFGRVGGHDELAAFAMGDAVRGAKFIQHPPAAHTMSRPLRAGRIIKAAMDHLAVARGDAIGNAAGRLGHRDVVAAQRRVARDGKPDDAGADDQNLHRVSALVLFRAARYARPRMII
jgi:hypothetical protein